MNNEANRSLQEQLILMRAALETIAKRAGLGFRQCAELAQSTLDKLDAPPAITSGTYTVSTGEDGEYVLHHGGFVVGTINYYADAVRIMDALKNRGAAVTKEQDKIVHEVMQKVTALETAAASNDPELVSVHHYDILKSLYIRPWMSTEATAWFCVNKVTGKIQYTDSREASAQMRDQQHGHWQVTPLHAGPQEFPSGDTK